MKEDQCNDLKWICLRTQQKREHIAQVHLRLIEGVEVYCPIIPFQKMTRRGRVWFNEGLFPSYLFAKLNFATHQTRVTSARGIVGAVRFGANLCLVPDSAIDELRAQIPNEKKVIAPGNVEAGTRVYIGNPLFFGLQAVVTQVLPARERVKILLEFLGRISEVELATSDISF